MTALTAGQLTAADLGREVTVTGALRYALGRLDSVEHTRIGTVAKTNGDPWSRPLPADTPVHVHDDREPEPKCTGSWASCEVHGPTTPKTACEREPDGEEVRRDG